MKKNKEKQTKKKKLSSKAGKPARQAAKRKSKNTASSGAKPVKGKFPPVLQRNLVDPFAEREALKYQEPIASRELIMQLLTEIGSPVPKSVLEIELNITPEQQEAFAKRLRAMQRDGQVMRDRRGRFLLVGKTDLVRGRIQGHREGFGFLIPEDGSEDLFVSPFQMRRVFHNDIVLARAIAPLRGKKEGIIVDVLERNTHQVAGRFYCENGVGRVVPDSRYITQEILIPERSFGSAQHGQLVIAKITRQPGPHEPPEGSIHEVLGDPMSPGVEVELALRSYEIPHVWSDEVRAEVAKLPDKVSPASKAGRLDLRELPLVTIDGENAQDFDDAVYCEPKKRGGWRLLVAIADVSYYIQPGTDLDREAFRRGNSVYFPHRVVPMLPEKLSNGLCSLNPHEDRLALVCELDLKANGEIASYKFIPAVIQSHARLTYNQVYNLLTEKTQPSFKEEKILPQLQNLHQLYQQLIELRKERGAIEFETVETKIEFDKNKKIRKIVPLVRNFAHKIIEECMLLANVAAADFMHKHKLPALYRNHEPPFADKLVELKEFLNRIGLRLGGGDQPTPKHFCAVLERAAKRPDSNIIQMVVLRTMSQAIYHPLNAGHFGLAFACYTHFTSPIRRYPDLLLHRSIHYLLQTDKRFAKYAVKMKISAKDLPYYQPEMPAQIHYGEHCSMTERRADDASRDVVAWLKCEYMLDKVGQTYTGRVSSVTGFGLFVELKEHFVEGLVHISELQGDYYRYDASMMALVGERTKKVYRVGDELMVVVAQVNLENRHIDFVLTSGKI